MTPTRTGLRTIFLQTQKLSVGSSALTPASGITYARSQDALVISLADGSYHAVENVSTEPVLSADASEIGLFSGALSTQARADFVKVEEEPMHKLDVNAIHGMSSYDNESFYLWIHECVVPRSVCSLFDVTLFRAERSARQISITSTTRSTPVCS